MKNYLLIIIGIAIGILLATTITWLVSHHRAITQNGEHLLLTYIRPFVFMLLISPTILANYVISNLSVHICDIRLEKFNTLLSAVFLVLSWIIVEIIFKRFDEFPGCRMAASEKHFCHVLAAIYVMIVSIAFIEDNPVYFKLASIAISIIIGAYTPIVDIFAGKSLSLIAKDVISTIVNGLTKRTLICSIAVALALEVVLAFNLDLIRFFNQFAYVECGFVIGCFIDILIIKIIDKKGKANKHKSNSSRNIP